MTVTGRKIKKAAAKKNVAASYNRYKFYDGIMNGVKVKLVHKRSGSGKWNISDKTQRNHLIQLSQDYIEELKDMELDEYIASETNAIKSKTVKKLQRKKSRLKEPELA